MTSEIQKAKLFIHRVGRVARAGRSGVAYSLVAPDEVRLSLSLSLVNWYHGALINYMAIARAPG